MRDITILEGGVVSSQVVMSTTSLLLDSPVSAETLYQEDTGSSISVSRSELDNIMSDNEKASCSGGGKKSGNVAIIEDFLNHVLRYGFPLGVDLGIVELGKTLRSGGRRAIVQNFEIDPFHPAFDDLHAILSQVFQLKVQYKTRITLYFRILCLYPGSLVIKEVGDDGTEEKFGFFVIKLPAKHLEDRQLASLSNAHRREIEFYTQTVPLIYCWMRKMELDFQLSIASCLYGKYNRPLEDVPVDGVIWNLEKAESILILEDLRPQGFGKRHYTEELSLDEARAALREMGKIHALTWSFQERERESLRKTWPFYYKPEYLAMLYEALLEDGLPRFEKHLKELIDANQDFTARNILERLTELKRKGLRGSLYKLMVASDESAPNCLVHMDFWCDNIFFRRKDDEDVVKNGSSEIFGDESDMLECRIVDWQMFSIGRPTNDIALLLFTGLEPATRRKWTDSLLEFYLGVFRETTEKLHLQIPFDLECLRAEYHTSQLLAVLQVIASIDLVLGEDVAEERLIEAVKDLMNQNLI